MPTSSLTHLGSKRREQTQTVCSPAQRSDLIVGQLLPSTMSAFQVRPGDELTGKTPWLWNNVTPSPAKSGAICLSSPLRLHQMSGADTTGVPRNSV